MATLPLPVPNVSVPAGAVCWPHASVPLVVVKKVVPHRAGVDEHVVAGGRGRRRGEVGEVAVAPEPSHQPQRPVR